MERGGGAEHASLFEGSLGFGRFLSVLSSLHVAGFQRVYLHVDAPPRGRWWEELAGENVTLVRFKRPRSVYQTHVGVMEHVSDIARSE